MRKPARHFSALFSFTLLTAPLTSALTDVQSVKGRAVPLPDPATTQPFDTHRIAVRSAASDIDPSAASRLGLDLDGAEPLGIDGWSLVPLIGARDVAAIGEITAALTRIGTYAAPVQLDLLGGPLVATPDLLLRRVEGPAPGGIELRALPGVIEVEPGLAGMERAYRLRTAGLDGFAVLAMVDELSALDEFEFVESDMIFSGRAANDLPTDPMFFFSWGLDAGSALNGAADIGLDASEAWKVTQGDPSVRVLVIDTGVDLNHPDLRQDPGIDTTGVGVAGESVDPCDNHGTWVAGCVSAIADNGIGTCGVAPRCKTVSARCFNTIPLNPCTGAWTAQYSWTADALEYAAQQGIQITNNSNIYGATSAVVTAKYLETRNVDGMVHFASAGNSGVQGLAYPSSLPTVMSIGALAPDGRRAPFSTFGPGLELLAPGSSVLTTDRSGADSAPGDYAWVGGTSFASPYSAGVAALVLTHVPWLTPDEVEEALRRGCIDMDAPGYDIQTGLGRLSAARVFAQLSPRDRRPMLVGSSTVPRGRRTAHGAALSADGTVMVFSSHSRHLVPGDTNGVEDVFVKDLVTGTIERVSVSSAGDQSGNASTAPDISADGRYVVFQSFATNLVTGDTNGAWDVFRHDRTTGTTDRVNLSSAGAQAIGGGRFSSPRISGDGSRVVFQSSARNLVAGASAGRDQIYLRDMTAGTTELMSGTPAGVQGDGGAELPDISDDGSLVVFDSWSTNLIGSDANGVVDVFLRHVALGTTDRVSLDDAGAPFGGGSYFARISGDGSTVSFTTFGAVDPSDTNEQIDLAVRDLVLGTTYSPALGAAGVGAGGSSLGELSADGRYVVFSSGDDSLVPGDTNGVADVFLYDRTSGAHQRVSLGASGQQATRTCTTPSLSDDASVIGFVSRDDDLTPGDRADRWSDAYVADRAAGTSTLVTGGS